VRALAGAITVVVEEWASGTGVAISPLDTSLASYTQSLSARLGREFVEDLSTSIEEVLREVQDDIQINTHDIWPNPLGWSIGEFNADYPEPDVEIDTGSGELILRFATSRLVICEVTISLELVGLGDIV
jgi:hypothetical protein